MDSLTFPNQNKPVSIGTTDTPSSLEIYRSSLLPLPRPPSHSHGGSSDCSKKASVALKHITSQQPLTAKGSPSWKHYSSVFYGSLCIVPASFFIPHWVAEHSSQAQRLPSKSSPQLLNLSFGLVFPQCLPIYLKCTEYLPN